MFRFSLLYLAALFAASSPLLAQDDDKSRKSIDDYGIEKAPEGAEMPTFSGKGKVNQAMAHGLPVVATGVASEGMGLRPGVDLLVADEPTTGLDVTVQARDFGELR